jgi:hypothetical protein
MSNKGATLKQTTISVSIIEGIQNDADRMSAKCILGLYQRIRRQKFDKATHLYNYIITLTGIFEKLHEQMANSNFVKKRNCKGVPNVSAIG